MADLYQTFHASDNIQGKALITAQPPVRLFKDMGNGTHAEVVTVAEPSTPPAPVTLNGLDAAGNLFPVTAASAQIAFAVQPPGTVYKVQLTEAQKDLEKVVLQDKTNDHLVSVITDFANPALPVVTYWDINLGALWTGPVTNLVAVSGGDTESDPVEMCDSGVSFLRWVVKKNGVLTNMTYDTTLGMQPYTVTNPANVSLGKCELSCAKTPQGVLTTWA
jgi:hypothetical protein